MVCSGVAMSKPNHYDDDKARAFSELKKHIQVTAPNLRANWQLISTGTAIIEDGTTFLRVCFDAMQEVRDAQPPVELEKISRNSRGETRVKYVHVLALTVYNTAPKPGAPREIADPPEGTTKQEYVYTYMEHKKPDKMKTRRATKNAVEHIFGSLLMRDSASTKYPNVYRLAAHHAALRWRDQIKDNISPLYTADELARTFNRDTKASKELVNYMLEMGMARIVGITVPFHIKGVVEKLTITGLAHREFPQQSVMGSLSGGRPFNGSLHDFLATSMQSSPRYFWLMACTQTMLDALMRIAYVREKTFGSSSLDGNHSQLPEDAFKYRQPVGDGPPAAKRGRLHGMFADLSVL